MSDLKQLVIHVTRETYKSNISIGYSCDDLHPCENQGLAGSCLECPGAIKTVPGCGWNFRLNKDGRSKRQLLFYRLVQDEPNLILDLPL